MNILLPTDFSENAKNAAFYALKCFGNIPCTFHLLHVLPQNKTDVPSSFYMEFEQFLTFMNAKKVNPQHEFKFAFKANSLIDAVREEVIEKKIDLIIMGTKGVSNKKSPIIGKNTSEVMTKVKCPVLAISAHAQFKSFKEILFPTDYKIHYSKEMLNMLFQLIATSKASIKILEIFNSEAEPSVEQVETKRKLQHYFLPETPLFRPLYPSKNKSSQLMFIGEDGIDMIVFAAKNLDISQKLLSYQQRQQIPFIEQLPLLVLH